MAKRIRIFAVIWIIAFLVALTLDSPIAQWVHTSGTGRFVEGKWWAQVLKEPGQFQFTLLVGVLLLQWREFNWKHIGFVISAGIVSGGHFLLKWIVGRTRPYKLTRPNQPLPFEFHLFRDGLYGLFHQTNLSFPSGHACTATALGASMLLIWPRGGWIFVALAWVVGLERIAENAHYCSDVVGGAGFGVLGTLLVHKALSRWLTPLNRRGFEVIS